MGESKFPGLPADAQKFLEATMRLLEMYMPGATKIEMMVGRNAKAILTIEGGPITREVIEDTLAHLAFYKRYFPKAGEVSAELDSPEKIITSLSEAWRQHREDAAASVLPPAHSGPAEPIENKGPSQS